MLDSNGLRDIILSFEEDRLPEARKINRKKAQAYVLKEKMYLALFSTDVVIHDIETSDDKVFVLCVVNNDGEKTAVEQYEVPGGIDVPIITLFKGDPKIEELLDAQTPEND